MLSADEVGENSLIRHLSYTRSTHTIVSRRIHSTHITLSVAHNRLACIHIAHPLYKIGWLLLDCECHGYALQAARSSCASMTVPRHRFHPSPHGSSGEWDRLAGAFSSAGTSHSALALNMFRLRTSNRCAVLSLSLVALVLGSVLLWLTAAHSSFGSLFSSSPDDVVAVSEDDMSVDVITLTRRYPPSELIGTEAAGDYVAAHILFFLHVPKTAGQSFTTALNAAADPYRPVLAARLPLDSKLGKGRQRKALGRRLDLTFMQRAELFDMLKDEKHDYFLNLYTSRVLVFGHTDTLIAQMFENDGRQVEFITLLRSPEERVLSHYCYMQTTWQESKRHGLVYPSWFRFLQAKSPEAVAALPPLPPLPGVNAPTPVELPVPLSYPAAAMSPASFVYYYRSTPMDRIDNWHTRAYSGCLHTPLPTTNAQHAICNSTELMLSEAKRRLRGFLFVGLTEHYNQTLRLLNYTLNVNIELAGSNTTPAAGNTVTTPANPLRSSAPSPAPFTRAGRPRPNAHLARRSGSRTLNRNRQKSKCIQAISANSTSAMDDMMDDIRAIEWMDIRLYEYATKLFWARVEEVESFTPGFTITHPSVAADTTAPIVAEREKGGG